MAGIVYTVLFIMLLLFGSTLCAVAIYAIAYLVAPHASIQ